LVTEVEMHIRLGPSSARANFLTVVLVLAMLALPAALTLRQVRVSAVVDVSAPNPTPYGYTVSLLLFIVPILAIGGWLVPRDGVKISKKSFVRTIALLFPLGVALDFFFAHLFLTFRNPNATLGLPVPALGYFKGGHIFIGNENHVIVGSVPVEEYVFYFTGFVFVLLLYIWLDEYWLRAYSIPADSSERNDFQRLLYFHPFSLVWALILIGGAILYRHLYDLRHGPPDSPGFPGYFIFLVVAALGPSTFLFPAALPVINWRAFSLVLFVILATSLLWEATLGVPYGWWDYQHPQMVGVFVTAWNRLPIEAICVWLAVTFQTTIVYEVVKRWQSSGKKARRAFLGQANNTL
jgi:hypothetical protein